MHLIFAAITKVYHYLNITSLHYLYKIHTTTISLVYNQLN